MKAILRSAEVYSMVGLQKSLEGVDVSDVTELDVEGSIVTGKACADLLNLKTVNVITGSSISEFAFKGSGVREIIVYDCPLMGDSTDISVDGIADCPFLEKLVLGSKTLVSADAVHNNPNLKTLEVHETVRFDERVPGKNIHSNSNLKEIILNTGNKPPIRVTSRDEMGLMQLSSGLFLVRRQEGNLLLNSNGTLPISQKTPLSALKTSLEMGLGLGEAERNRH